MCDFGISEGLALASFAIGTATAVSQAAGQQSQASAQAQRNNIQAQYIAQNDAQLQLQAQQQTVYKNDEAFQQLQNQERAARAAKATALTSAGDNGIDPGSTSVQALSQEYDSRQGEFDDNVRYNREADDRQIALQMQGFNTQAISEDNQLRQPVFPSYISTGLNIAGEGFKAYNMYQKNQPPKTGTTDNGFGGYNAGNFT
jgi:hypothetical protein